MHTLTSDKLKFYRGLHECDVEVIWEALKKVTVEDCLKEVGIMAPLLNTLPQDKAEIFCTERNDEIIKVYNTIGDFVRLMESLNEGARQTFYKAMESKLREMLLDNHIYLVSVLSLLNEKQRLNLIKTLGKDLPNFISGPFSLSQILELLDTEQRNVCLGIVKDSLPKIFNAKKEEFSYGLILRLLTSEQIKEVFGNESLQNKLLEVYRKEYHSFGILLKNLDKEQCEALYDVLGESFFKNFGPITLSSIMFDIVDDAEKLQQFYQVTKPSYLLENISKWSGYDFARVLQHSSEGERAEIFNAALETLVVKSANEFQATLRFLDKSQRTQWYNEYDPYLVPMGFVKTEQDLEEIIKYLTDEQSRDLSRSIKGEVTDDSNPPKQGGLLALADNIIKYGKTVVWSDGEEKSGKNAKKMEEVVLTQIRQLEHSRKEIEELIAQEQKLLAEAKKIQDIAKNKIRIEAVEQEKQKLKERIKEAAKMEMYAQDKIESLEKEKEAKEKELRDEIERLTQAEEITKNSLEQRELELRGFDVKGSLQVKEEIIKEIEKLKYKLKRLESERFGTELQLPSNGGLGNSRKRQLSQQPLPRCR